MNELDYCSQSIQQYQLPSGFEIMEKIDFELLPQYISLLAEIIKDIDIKIKNSNQNPN